MSAFLVTSPYGQLPSHRWLCIGCGSFGEDNSGFGEGREAVRKAAVEHVETDGHEVRIFDGTSEHFLPLSAQAGSGI